MWTEQVVVMYLVIIYKHITTHKVAKIQEKVAMNLREAKRVHGPGWREEGKQCNYNVNKMYYR